VSQYEGADVCQRRTVRSTKVDAGDGNGKRHFRTQHQPEYCRVDGEVWSLVFKCPTRHIFIYDYDTETTPRGYGKVRTRTEANLDRQTNS
jgi:hypothetical protein